MPGRQRAKRSPAPCQGCEQMILVLVEAWEPLSSGPESFEEVPRVQVLLVCCWKTNV